MQPNDQADESDGLIMTERNVYTVRKLSDLEPHMTALLADLKTLLAEARNGATWWPCEDFET